MRWYLDASVALHLVLPGGDRRAAGWLERRLCDHDEMFSSALLRVEVSRVLRRECIDPALATALFDRLDVVGIDDGVLRFAAAIEPHMKSLDAIHLATCALLGSSVTLATHDVTMHRVAAQLGLDALDPLA